MAPSTNYKLLGLKIALTVVFISSLTFSPSKSVDVGEEITSNREIRSTSNMQEIRKMVLGSRPPGCVNKCLKCRPCMATLVIPPHDQIRRRVAAGTTTLFRRPSFSFHREDDDTSYYLLSWKCRCGDKLFRP